MAEEKNDLNLNAKIDENRKKLEEMISRHDSVNHDEILLVSQQLDQLITLFYRERKENKK